MLKLNLMRMNNRGMVVAVARVVGEAHHREQLLLRPGLIPNPGEIAKTREFTREQIDKNQILRIGHSFLEMELRKFPLSFLKGILRPQLNKVIEQKIIRERIREREKLAKGPLMVINEP